MLGSIVSTLTNGPIYFNCYPNFSAYLFDDGILDTMTLNVQTKGYDFQKNSNIYPFAVIYRIHTKVMHTIIPKCLKQSPVGESVLIQANINKTSINTTKTIKWKDVQIPTSWILPSVVSPKEPEIQELENIITHPDGDVEIQFSSFRRPNLEIRSVATSSQPRYSFQKFSNDTQNETHLQGIRNDPIPQTFYTTNQYSHENSSPNMSPTYSQMDPSVNMIQKTHFEINKKYLNDDFNSIQNSKKSDWFFETYMHEQRISFRQIWYDFMNQFKCNVFFFTWFEIYANQQNIFYPFRNIQTTSKRTSTWNIIEPPAKTIESVHPPKAQIKITHNNNDLIAAPFKTIPSGEPISNSKELKKIIEQNNYTNCFLHTIAGQGDRIESLLQKDAILPKSSDTEPFFKPFDEKLKFTFIIDHDILDDISNKLSKLQPFASSSNTDFKNSNSKEPKFIKTITKNLHEQSL